MRIVDIREIAIPLKSQLRNSGFDFSEMTTSVVAVITDVVRNGKPIAGYAFNPITKAWLPEINAAVTHLREVLGDQTYETLACKGEAMTTAEMVTYAYGQIDQVRAELNAVS